MSLPHAYYIVWRYVLCTNNIIITLRMKGKRYKTMPEWKRLILCYWKIPVLEGGLKWTLDERAGIGKMKVQRECMALKGNIVFKTGRQKKVGAFKVASLQKYETKPCTTIDECFVTHTEILYLF